MLLYLVVYWSVEHAKEEETAMLFSLQKTGKSSFFSLVVEYP